MNEKQTLTIYSIRTTCFWLISTMLLIIADQVTKKLAVVNLKNQSGISIIPDVLELNYLENKGMAFGMLQGKQILFLILSIAFCIFLFYLLIRIPKTPYYRPLMVIGAFLAAGALGNFIDRLSHGYVIDFIYFSLIDFPVFNLADIFVVCGGIALVLVVLFRYKDEDFEFILPKHINKKG